MKHAQVISKSQTSKVASIAPFSLLTPQLLDRGSLIIVALFVVFLPFWTPRIYATDEVQYFAYLRSLYFDGDLDFRNEYQHFADIGLKNGDPAVFNALMRDNPQDPPLNPQTGVYRNVAPIGSALLWSPGFVLADGLVRAANSLGARIAADGYSWPYIWAICFMSALYSLLGLLLTYRLARRYSGVFAATLATVSVWLATPLVFYTYILMPWSHGPGFFLFALFLTLWLGAGEAPLLERGAQRSPGTWALLGLVGGLMTITREQLGLLLILPAVEGLGAYYMIFAKKRPSANDKPIEDRGSRIALVDPRSSILNPRSSSARSPFTALLGGHAIFLLAFTLALIPQFLTYQALNGRPRPSSTVEGKLDFLSPHLLNTLIDPQHGAFLWSPILMLGLVGMIWLWRRDRILAALLLLGFLAQTYINGAISTWHLTGSFGFRRLIECTPIFVLGLAALLEWLRPRLGRWPLLAAALLLVAWNAGLIANWTVLHIELRKGLVWPDLWGWQLQTPRRVLATAGELLFHRCGFFKNGRC
jgi:hypothetical protein